MATTLGMPLCSSAVATEAKASPACVSSIPDWQAFSTTAGTAYSCRRALRSRADFGSGSPLASSKTKRPWGPCSMCGECWAVVEGILPGMTKRSMAEIVRQRDGFGQRLIQRQRACDRAGDLRHFDRVGHPGPVQIALVIYEHLGLVGEAAKCIGMDDAVAIALEFAAILRRRLGKAAAAGLQIVRGIGRQASIAHDVTALASP